MPRTPLKENSLPQEERHRLVMQWYLFACAKAKQWSHGGRSFEDLKQAAMMGLVVASRHFLPELGYKFQTYAGYWIFSKLQDEAEKQDKQCMTNLGSAANYTITEDEDEPSLLEFSALTKYTSPRNRKVLRLLYEKDMTLREAGDKMCLSDERIRQLRNRALLDIKRAVAAGQVRALKHLAR